MVLGVKTELQKLRRKMVRIGNVLKDAERKSIQDATVKGWVDELKDVMYEADDVIDLCMIQGAGLLQDDHFPPKSRTCPRVRCDFPFFSCVRHVRFRYEIADKIKNLNLKLQEISEDKVNSSLIASSKSNDEYVVNEFSYRESSSLPELDIVGWDIRHATKNLVELLVSQHEQKCCLFAIVGMGGIGKTTLAQQIYNDSKINDAFVLRSWIWVSKSFTSKTDLLKEIIRNAEGTYGESTTIAELQNILCDVLCRKSLFIVLDDVWDASIWTDLIKRPIERTTTKCRVLVTTRDRNTAIKMGATHVHNVNELPLDSGWELLCRRVFTNNDIGDMKRMKDIGLKIVEKCDGLPIAIKTIAGVLVTKDRSRREWESVLNSDAWTITGLPEELRGALYLSYESLPSSLKQCFLYCSLNPPGDEFSCENIICQWIAEGFIEASGSASIDDVARGYYKELIWRSFLQPKPDSTDMSRCTMHDTLRALAQFLVGEENFSGDPQEAQSSRSLKKLRRLNIVSKRETVSISHLTCLRRLSLWTPPSLNTQLIQNLKQLRLLILNGDKIDNIPDSIGDLVHLRLLDLSFTSICKLPDSLGNLINLQFVVLDKCVSLHILPKSITKLCNLLRLRLSYTPLNYIPKGIGKLEHLQHVMGFIIGDCRGDGDEGCDLEEIQMLEKLTHLRIENLEKVTNRSGLVLSNKTHLRMLALNCTPNIQWHIQQEKMDNIVQVFDELCPPSGLEKLVIDGYFGGQYPKWMISSTIDTVLPELTSLHLYGWSNCPQLPQLGRLPRLKFLKIEGAIAIVSIGPEFLGNNGEPTEIAFPKLEYLLFLDMINWEEWSLISGDQGDKEPESSKPLLFPHLKRVVIGNCPKLKALPRGLNQASFRGLKIVKARSLSRICHLPALREIKVIDCPMLECVEKLESLQRLVLVDNQKNSTSLPRWLVPFLQQREEKSHDDDLFILHLECSAQVLRDCLQGHRYWSFLQQVPRFTAYAKNRRMYLKYTKEPYYYETNITDEDQEDEIFYMNPTTEQ